MSSIVQGPDEQGYDPNDDPSLEMDGDKTCDSCGHPDHHARFCGVPMAVEPTGYCTCEPEGWLDDTEEG